MKTVAILGPTASGKTALALRLAKAHRCAVLSLDSLAVYRHIDIASAKPTLIERADVPHFGIDEIDPDTRFSAAVFVDLYKKARDFCRSYGYHLLIVGGTGFYLKTLLEGLSPLPPLRKEVRRRCEEALRDLPGAYKLLSAVDADYAAKLSPADRYRIQKGLQIYWQTGMPPTRFYAQNRPEPVLKTCEIFEIDIDKPLLWEQIARRTEKMFQDGLIDEVADLERRYGRNIPPMEAIGIAEVLDFFDGKLTLERCKEAVTVHTRQLAKRQKTFNRTQFPPHPLVDPKSLERQIAALLQS